MKKLSFFKSTMLIVITVFCLTLCPVKVHAGGSVDIAKVIKGVNSDGTVTVGSTVYVLIEDLNQAYGGNFVFPYASNEVKCEWVIGDTVIEATDNGERFSYTVKPTDVGKKLLFYTLTKTDDTYFNNNTEAYTIVASSAPSSTPLVSASIDVKGAITADGKMTVTGHAGTGRTFTELSVVDNLTGKAEKVLDTYYSDISTKQTFTKVIDTRAFPVGYHLLRAKLDNGKYVYYKSAFPTAIYDVPAIKVNENFFSTGSNYICYRPYFTVPKDIDGKEMGVYIQLYDGKTWGDVYGPFSSYTILKTKFFKGNAKSGGTRIKADTTYKVRTFFAKNTQYGGKSYPVIGKFSKTVSIKTGKAAKPAVKSVTAKCIQQKKIKLHADGRWDPMGKWIPPIDSSTWTTTFKVTVKLKKKPGTKGIYIGNKKLKGNKKSYTVTIKDSGKLKGKKIKVMVCSYNDKNVGGYSASSSKKVKIQ